MTFREWISDKYNLYSLSVPILFIVGALIYHLGFIIGVAFGILAFAFRDFCMGGSKDE